MMTKVICALLTLIMLSSAFAIELVPPLVPNGENINDFPNWYIDGFDYYSHIDIDPNEKLLAASTLSGIIKLWDLKSKQLIKIMRKDQRSFIFSVDFNHDGGLLAVGTDRGSIEIWSVATSQLVQSFDGHADFVYSVAFNNEGTMLASASRKDTKIWSVRDGKLLHTLEQDKKNGWGNLAFSKKSNLLASVSSESVISLWDANTGSFIKTLIGHKDRVISLDFDHEDNLLVSGSKDKTVVLWDFPWSCTRCSILKHPAH